MFLSWGRAEIGDAAQIEPSLDLAAIRVLGQADRARQPADALQPRGDVDAVAHQIAVALSIMLPR